MSNEINREQVEQAVESHLKEMRENPSAHRTGIKILSTTHDAEAHTLHINLEFTPMHSISDPVDKEPGFKDYFTDEVDYPRNVAANPLPMNTLWCYISSTFLNGFINYVKIIDAQLLNRYAEMDEVFNEAEDGPFQSYQSAAKGWITPPSSISKRALFDLYTDPTNLSYPKLNALGDDVLILAKCKDDGAFDVTGMYMFFWFDHDVSDCCIGRFKTDDEESVIIEKFRNYVRTGIRFDAPTTIPLNFFSDGWTSFF